MSVYAVRVIVHRADLPAAGIIAGRAIGPDLLPAKKNAMRVARATFDATDPPLYQYQISLRGCGDLRPLEEAEGEEAECEK